MVRDDIVVDALVGYSSRRPELLACGLALLAEVAF